MGTANNSIVKGQDVINAGGIKNVYSMTEHNNKLLKELDFKGDNDGVAPYKAPLFHNVTLKSEYGDNHLTKFQDLDIAETYPITLGVELPSTAWTGYTLYGFNVTVTYPNGSTQNKRINIRETTTDKSIEIANCIDNARVKVLPPLLNNTSGATISGTLVVKSDADVEISPLFTEGDGVICTGPLGYPCFSLKMARLEPNPDYPVTPNPDQPIGNRKIDIVIKFDSLYLYRLFIDNATYGTGTTLSEVQDIINLRQAVIGDLTKEHEGINHATTIETTIEVPSNAWVRIYLTDPKGSTSNNLNLVMYSWVEENERYVEPGVTRETVTYTVTTYNIN